MTIKIEHILSVALSSVIIGLILSAFPAAYNSAFAKETSEFTAEIQALEQAADEYGRTYEQSRKELSESIRWCYKNEDNTSLLSILLSGENFTEFEQRTFFVSKVHDEYSRHIEAIGSSKKEMREAKNKLIELQEEEDKLIKEQQRRREVMAHKYEIQFPQYGEEYEWSSMPYWGGTIADSGCGVCAYTVMINALTGSEYTPATMLPIRGDWKGMDGFPNDHTGTGELSHSEWTKKTYDISSWEISNSAHELAESLSIGERCAIVCSHGNAFKNKTGQWRWSSGHFICVTGYDDQGFHVSDSAYSPEEGANVIYTIGEMEQMLAGANHVVIYSN